jgi:seryl-tRNA synthetase
MCVENPDELLRKEYLDALIDARLLIPTGVPGVYGRGHVFEDVLESLDRLITKTGRDDRTEVVRFPPVINRADFENSEYLNSFPQLAGTVFSFDGTPKEHMRLLDCVHEGKDWSEFQKMTSVVLTPAACYPLYPMAARRGQVPETGSLFDVFSYCFRNEPSTDPARMQIFRMREFVLIGSADDVLPWRDAWLERGTALLQSLDLPVASDLANDPFFGRGGRMLAANQRAQKLKFELLVPICSTESPTAIMSFNYHQDHFGTLFGIRRANGEVAHTACVGFGMERIVLALFKTLGLDPTNWPVSVRARLWHS